MTQLGDTFSDVLVFAPWNTHTIFDIFISSYPTRAQPAQKRGLPANAIYRYAKFAFLHWDLDTFEWFAMDAIDRIEQEVFVSPTWRSIHQARAHCVSPRMLISLGCRSGYTTVLCFYTSFRMTRLFGIPASRLV